MSRCPEVVLKLGDIHGCLEVAGCYLNVFSITTRYLKVLMKLGDIHGGLKVVGCYLNVLIITSR